MKRQHPVFISSDTSSDDSSFLEEDHTANEINAHYSIDLMASSSEESDDEESTASQVFLVTGQSNYIYTKKHELLADHTFDSLTELSARTMLAENTLIPFRVSTTVSTILDPATTPLLRLTIGPLRFCSAIDRHYHTYAGLESICTINNEVFRWSRISFPIMCDCKTHIRIDDNYDLAICGASVPLNDEKERHFYSPILESLPPEMFDHIRSFFDIKSVRLDGPFSCIDFFSLAYLFGLNLFKDADIIAKK